MQGEKEVIRFRRGRKVSENERYLDIGTSVSGDVKDSLHSIARERRVTFSALLREIITDYVRQSAIEDRSQNIAA